MVEISFTHVKQVIFLYSAGHVKRSRPKTKNQKISMGIDPFRNSSCKSAYYCVLHKPSGGIPEKIKNKKVFTSPTTFFWGMLTYQHLNYH